MKHIIIHTQVYFLIPVLLLLFPNGLVLWWIIAAAIHEIYHILMLWIFRIEIISIEIRITGAKIETAPMVPYKEMIVALAGPIGALSFLAFAQLMPQLVICVIAQSAFNLLPVYPLDGGRALRCVFAGKLKDKNLYTFEKGMLYAVVLGVLFLSMRYKLGIFPIVPAMALIIKHRNANIPCKDREQRVQ